MDGAATWAGVDVGGPRKGFDCVVVEGPAVRDIARIRDPQEAAQWLLGHRPAVIGIDSPCRAAPVGERSRESERALARAVCGIRWTPDEAALAHGNYYGWIRHGLGLYAALDRAGRSLGRDVVEVFPTASWTRWAGPRGRRSRAAWSTAALRALGLAGIPAVTNQDLRDAIAAAVTARQFAAGDVERFGDIVVPPAAVERSSARPRPRR